MSSGGPVARVARLLALAALCLSLSSCRARPVESEPPLRPLLYTEAPHGVELRIPGYEEWQDPNHDPTAWPSAHSTTIAGAPAELGGPAMAPDALMMDVFAALSSGDRDRLQVHLFDAETLGAAARMAPDAAARTAEEVRADTEATLALMAPRRGGRGIVLVPGQVTIGRPRKVDGSLATANETPVMHWGSELTFGIRGTQLEFTLRFPNILVDERGVWRLRSAPTLEGRFASYRAMGLDLMPELMDSEHAPMPLSVGNYWQYRTRTPAAADAAPAATARPGYRDAVTEVATHDGYRVVRFRRMYDDPNRQSERFAWLVTPTRLYECGRECLHRAADVSWILGYGERETPLFVFPLRRGTGWAGGGQDHRNNVVRVSPEGSEVAVPAGTFPDASELTRSTSAGRVSTFFVPGIGVVMRRTQTTLETTVEELADFRILP